MHFLGIKRQAAAVAVAMSLTLGACGGTDRMSISAAASMRGVVPALFPAARLNTGGSDTLARQILEGARVDLFISADPRYASELEAAGRAGPGVVIATNRLVVIVPRANRAAITQVDDLRRSGVRLVLGQESVPIGAYARTALARLGLRAALGNVVSNEPAVDGVVAKVALDEADAGIVYATDAAAAGSRVRVIPIPRRAQPDIRYVAAVVFSGARRTDARRALMLLTGPRGRRALAAAGFGLPPTNSGR